MEHGWEKNKLIPATCIACVILNKNYYHPQHRAGYSQTLSVVNGFVNGKIADKIRDRPALKEIEVAKCVTHWHIGCS